MCCALLALLFTQALAPALSQAEMPYVHTISREEGSLEGISLDIEKATQVNFMAGGYEKYGIIGRRVTIEGSAINRTGFEYRDLSLTFTARDIFGNSLDECQVVLSLPPGGREPFLCVVEAKDASDLNRITYKVEKFRIGE